MCKEVCGGMRCPDFEFQFKYFPARIAIFVNQVNGGGLNPTPRFTIIFGFINPKLARASNRIVATGLQTSDIIGSQNYQIISTLLANLN